MAKVNIQIRVAYDSNELEANIKINELLTSPLRTNKT
jgi:hypothetical protein